jgi:hypothetical protein
MHFSLSNIPHSLTPPIRFRFPSRFRSRPLRPHQLATLSLAALVLFSSYSLFQLQMRTSIRRLAAADKERGMLRWALQVSRDRSRRQDADVLRAAAEVVAARGERLTAAESVAALTASHTRALRGMRAAEGARDDMHHAQMKKALAKQKTAVESSNREIKALEASRDAEVARHEKSIKHLADAQKRKEETHERLRVAKAKLEDDLAKAHAAMGEMRQRDRPALVANLTREVRLLTKELFGAQGDLLRMHAQRKEDAKMHGAGGGAGQRGQTAGGERRDGEGGRRGAQVVANANANGAKPAAVAAGVHGVREGDIAAFAVPTLDLRLSPAAAAGAVAVAPGAAASAGGAVEGGALAGGGGGVGGVRVGGGSSAAAAAAAAAEVAGGGGGGGSSSAAAAAAVAKGGPDPLAEQGGHVDDTAVPVPAEDIPPRRRALAGAESTVKGEQNTRREREARRGATVTKKTLRGGGGGGGVVARATTGRRR